MKNTPDLPEGSSKSEPTWVNAFGVFLHVGFFVFDGRNRLGTNGEEPHGRKTPETAEKFMCNRSQVGRCQPD